MLHLERVDETNIQAILDLEVSEAQRRFVSSNEYSMAQARAAAGSDYEAFPFGIYDDDTPVGFIMVGYNEPLQNAKEKTSDVLKNNYSIWRFMIDKRYQGKGYGRAAINLALDFVRTWPCGKAENCVLSFKPTNEVAKKLYNSVGFIENGESDGDEVFAVLKL